MDIDCGATCIEETTAPPEDELDEFVEDEPPPEQPVRVANAAIAAASRTFLIRSP